MSGIGGVVAFVLVAVSVLASVLPAAVLAWRPARRPIAATFCCLAGLLSGGLGALLLQAFWYEPLPIETERLFMGVAGILLVGLAVADVLLGVVAWLGPRREAAAGVPARNG